MRPFKTWSIQLYADLVVIPQLLSLAEKLRVEIVIDQIGSPLKMEQHMALSPRMERPADLIGARLYLRQGFGAC